MCPVFSRTVRCSTGKSCYCPSMYGKVFEQMFTGSLVGAGPDVFAVWTYAIVHARSPGEVELNPRLLSVMLGMTVEEVERVIEKLCSPDPYSRTPDLDGTRMVRRGQFLYFLPNWQKYRDIRNDEERREKERTYKRNYRASLKSGCPDLSDSQPDNFGQSENVRVPYASESASLASVVEEREHEREETPKKPRKPRTPKPKPDMALFEKFLEAYRKRDDIKKAEKAWIKNVGCDETLAKEVILAAEVYASFEAVKKEDRKYQPYPATWLNGERWRDERIQKEVANRQKSPSLDDENIDWDTPAF